MSEPVPVRRMWRERLIDILVGGLIGGFLGLVAAWNLMIYLGVEGGYEASLRDAFEHSLLAGILVVVALMGGPSLGIWLARRRRGSREGEAKMSGPPAD